VRDLFDARSLPETAIARSAAERRREADLVLLGHAADRCRALFAKAQPAGLFEADRDFHHTVAKAGQNLVIADLQRQLDGWVEALRATTLTAPGRWPASVDQHDQPVAAVGAGDPAAAAAEQHLRDMSTRDNGACVRRNIGG
jgi:DNA-binding FadR family transcriptional regulator